jgi:hypothetical protein
MPAAKLNKQNPDARFNGHRGEFQKQLTTTDQSDDHMTTPAREADHMSIDNPSTTEAQASAPNISSRRHWRIHRRGRQLLRQAEAARIAEKQFKIRCERAVAAIRRSGGGLSTKAACRSVGLAPREADKIVARLCDEHSVIRRRATQSQIDPIKVQRAVWKIALCRGRCGVKAACLAVGLEGREARRAERIVSVICDERGIARPRSLRVLLPHWTKNSPPTPAFLPPSPKARAALRKVDAELHADQLQDQEIPNVTEVCR